MNMLQGALARAAEGWRIFPVHAGSKTPAIESWQARATRDPDKIEAWWAENPGYNIGCLVGSELVVVDVDVRARKMGAESLARIVSEYGPMPPTRTHRTSSGGWHYIFTRPEDWKIAQGALHANYPGIDIKTGNAVIILPPSHTIASSRSDEGDYTVENSIEPARAPDWVEELRNQGHSGQRLYATSSAPGGEGDRNNTLIRIAGRLRRRGQDEQAIFNVIWGINTGRFAKPLSEYEVRQIARSAMRWKPAPLGGIRVIHRNRITVTDATSARWLALARGDSLRFVGDQGKWYAWDGRRWTSSANRVSYEMGVALDILRDEERTLSESVRDKQQMDLAMPLDDCGAIITTLETAVGQAGCWALAPLEPEFPVESKELDADPYLFNVNNGIIDLRTGELIGHDRLMLITHLAEVDYNPHADMTDWETFVLWCCCGDEEQAHWLKVALGQALIGQQDEHMLMFFFGTGGNGKTQLTDAIRLTMGTYALESTADLITVKGKDTLHPEMMASLRGKRFVICPEPDKGTHWNAGRVKSLNGGEEQRARHLYGREFSFKPTHTMVVHGNHQPEMRDHSDGFRRRIKLIPFLNKVEPQNRVTELGAKLAGPGVLRWLVEGAVEYTAQLNQLAPSQMIARATEDYIDEQNHIKRWHDEWCVPNEDGWVSNADWYPTYQFWCRSEGILYIETKQAVVAFLKSQGYKPRMRQVAGKMTRGWGGFELVRMAVDDLPA